MLLKPDALNDKKYLISAKWWQQWCDYVNFTVESSSSDSDADHNSLQIFYSKPGQIINLPLLKLPSLKLKHNLVEHFDYQVVSADSWKYLSNWYGFDHRVCRRLVKDPMHSFKLDLYPDELP